MSGTVPDFVAIVPVPEGPCMALLLVPDAERDFLSDGPFSKRVRQIKNRVPDEGQTVLV